MRIRFLSPDYELLRDAAFDRLLALDAREHAKCQDEIDEAQRELEDADERLRNALHVSRS